MNKESSTRRPEALREAAKEKTECVGLLAAGKHRGEALENTQHQKKGSSMFDDILEDGRKAAYCAEEDMEEHTSDDITLVKEGVNLRQF